MSIATQIDSKHVIDSLRKQLPFLRSNFSVEKLGVFGSVAKGTFNSQSDVDLLVEFTTSPGWRFIELAEYLESILGRKVDVLTPAGMASIRSAKTLKNIQDSLVYV